jgi:transposase-like protein
MKPTKLSDSDKREIIRLYRQSEENTITLAKRYGVSSSTVRRLLQSAFSEPEYESLVQQKQKRLPDRTIIAPQQIEVIVDSSSSSESSASPLSITVPQSMVNRRPTIRKPALSTSEPVADMGGRKNIESDLDVAGASSEAVASSGGSDYVAVTAELKAILPEEGLLLGEDFSDFEEDEDDDEDDSDLDDLDGENLGDEDSLFEGSLLGVRSGDAIGLRVQMLIEVLPLSEAYIPKVCYVVVDRAAELITRPLKAFGELGQIPPEEIREKTLPVFDNHRVAGRFATRHQRVFKIPDGKMLQKTAPYLQAKGITRLLIDGQVYSL